jgi:hypothetical protein
MKRKRRKTPRQSEETPQPGPSPIIVVGILLGCILILSIIFAALKVFVIPEPHQCRAEGTIGNLPDPQCTPGAGIDVPLETLCARGYTATVRNVSYETKQQVYASYSIAERDPGEYEVDHLIPLELGGTNDIRNLWPEPADPRPGYHEKDKVENYLHDQVCDRKMNLSEAQRIIATNWTMALQK